jgi:hypothetical protein
MHLTPYQSVHDSHCDHTESAILLQLTLCP